MKQKKIPERVCLGCQKLFPKRELIRVVRSPEGEYSIDHTGKKSGRGAYLCHNLECFELARKARRFERSFQGQIDDTVYESLARELAQERSDG